MKTLTFGLVILLAAYTSKASSLKYQNKDGFAFEKRIAAIHSRVVDLTNIFALHDVKEFNEVYFAPLKFEKPVIEYLQKPVGLENKLIAMCMMTKLPLNQYIDLLNSYFILYNKRKIDEQVLNRGVFNEFDKDNRLAREYKNPQVKDLLSKMISCKTLSKQFRSDLEATVNGKRYNDLKRTGHI